MQLPVLELPRIVPPARERQPQANIPQTRGERERCKELVVRYLESVRLVPPLSMEELKVHADGLIADHGLAPSYRDYVGVLLSNETWREQLATVPYERRLLMLP